MNQLYQLKAFTNNQYGGNKAGVYVFADDLNEQEMQSIAKRLGFSETAFVMKSDIADFKVRFFTPISEVDICGHASIATFNLLRDLNIIFPGVYTQETKAGILNLDIQDDLVYMALNQPKFFEEVSASDLQPCFSQLSFHSNLKPQIVSAGLKEIFLPVKDQHTLNHMQPNLQEILQLSKEKNVIGIHAFALDHEVDAYGRNFAPIVGINEESATGTSNGALACYLFKYVHQKDQYVLRQGYSMNQPSQIIAKLTSSNHQIESVWIGGKAVIIDN